MRKLLICLLNLYVASACQKSGYEKTEDGVIIYLRKAQANRTEAVQLRAVTEDIIQVRATPNGDFSDRESLMLEQKNFDPAKFEIEAQAEHVVLRTAHLTATVSLETGEVTFADSTGQVKLQELAGGGKTFRPDTLENEKVYQIRQVFDSPEDEAFYGLGQFQDEIMNYKGHNLELMQQNMVAVVPFLVSIRNYGILWDNYSVTRFGDPRPYEHLNSLQLTTPDGQPGLLARYFLPGETELFTERIEPAINYEFREQKANWPEDFPVVDCLITWTGFMTSEFSGLHKFLLYSSGYTKLWLDGNLIVDNWRQTWLPGTDPLDLQMETEKKYEIRLEWRPDGFGNGPYMALKWLSPVAPDEQNRLSLFSEVADQIDYYFVNGENLDDVISGYRQLTGKATLLPRWTMGLWQSRERYKTQDELMEVVKTFREREIPLDNIVLDWQYWPTSTWGSHEFDTERFPDPDGMIKDLHEKYNARIMISVWPKFDVGTDNFRAFEENDWLYMRNIETQTPDMLGDVFTFYDAFDPGARQLMWQQMNKRLFQKGIDAWWMDATEPEIRSNIPNEEKALRMHPTALGHGARYMNAYSLVNSQAVYEGQRQTAPNQRVFILTRSAFAGQQRYASATWSGDVAARWDDLRTQISAGLNFSLAGIPYWTTDIGGFEVERRFENAHGNDEEWREFMTRWFQFGAFCPLFRVHGQYPFREIFHVAPPEHAAYKTMVAYDKLRYRLMPYIYSLAGHAYHDDGTIMRALIMDFSGDRHVYEIGDQYMFGPVIMVCPVYEYQARNREVYLPAGSDWYDLHTGKHFDGGQTTTAAAPLSDIPLFVKAGSILPFGPDIQYAMEKPADPLTLFVYTGRNAEFVLYEDENVNYNYEQGAFTKIPISYDEASEALTIGARQGSFPGMLEQRTFRIIRIGADRPLPLDFEMEPDFLVEYDGQEQSVVLR